MPKVWHKRQQHLEHALTDWCYHCSEYNPEGLSRALHLREAGCAGQLLQTIGYSPVMVCWALAADTGLEGSGVFQESAAPAGLSVLGQQGSAP